MSASDNDSALPPVGAEDAQRTLQRQCAQVLAGVRLSHRLLNVLQ